MRIKINDKIYRLKEIESGVDSLMELVEEQKYKNGDFIYEDGRIMIVKSYPNLHHANVWHTHSDKISYNGTYAVDFSAPTFRHATEEERQILIDAMRKDGKRWNADKKCIEDIPERKFKAGDKVKIKDGISSDTHGLITEDMDKLIGERLIVIGYNSMSVLCSSEVEGFCHNYLEDWLEPWIDEPKVGDWVIAWNNDMSLAVIGVKINATPMQACKHVLNNNSSYKYAVKFNGTRDHLEKIRSGKV